MVQFLRFKPQFNQLDNFASSPHIGSLGRRRAADVRMSEFINYNKRGVNLPEGCKDLIDVLKRQQQSSAQSFIPPGETPKVTRGESGTVKVSEIETYVTMLFQSQADMSTLMLSTGEAPFTIDFTHIKGHFMQASAVFEENAERERLIREFFVQHALQLPVHDGAPGHLIEGVPVHLIFRINPLPSDATASSKLLARLFLHVCGLSADAPLTFRYYEVANAA
jgi:hypothetical protein